MNFFSSFLINFLSPIVCYDCGTEDDYLCKTCKKQLYVHPEMCFVCGNYFPHFGVCYECDFDASLGGVLIGFAYEGILKKMIGDFKYSGVYDLSSFFSRILALLLLTHPVLSKNFDRILLTYVPSHPLKEVFLRGYNQSKLLAVGLGSLLHLPVLDLASMNTFTFGSIHLNRRHRITGSRSKFSLNKNFNGCIPENSLLLIVDDVLTTGSTLNSLSGVILDEYSSLEIRGLVLARRCR